MALTECMQKMSDNQVFFFLLCEPMKFLCTKPLNKPLNFLKDCPDLIESCKFIWATSAAHPVVNSQSCLYWVNTVK